MVNRPFFEQWLALAAVCLLLAAAPLRAAAQASSGDGKSAAYPEADVKAAFLYNFGNYVQWPDDGGTEEEPITFAILEAPEVGAALERLVRGRTLQNRSVRVRRLRSVNELDGAEVLFIGARENSRLSQLIDAVEGPTLIVTDAPDGLADGAMINFQIIDRRLRFEIALPAAEAAGLTLSSRLLSAALRVETTRCSIECRGPSPLPASSPTRPLEGSAAFAGDALSAVAPAAGSDVVVEIEAQA